MAPAPLRGRSQPMRIGLNLLHAMPSVGGAWNYIASFLDVLSESDVDNQYVAYCTPRSVELVPRRDNFRAVQIDTNASKRVRRVVYEHIGLPRVARRDGIECMHWFGNTRAIAFPIPSVVTIYDVMVFSRPESFS